MKKKILSMKWYKWDEKTQTFVPDMKFIKEGRSDFNGMKEDSFRMEA